MCEWVRKLMDRCGSRLGASRSAIRTTPPRFGCCAAAGAAARNSVRAARSSSTMIRRAMARPLLPDPGSTRSPADGLRASAGGQVTPLSRNTACCQRFEGSGLDFLTPLSRTVKKSKSDPVDLAARHLPLEHAAEGLDEAVHVGVGHGEGAGPQAALGEEDAFVEQPHEDAERRLRILRLGRAVVGEAALGPVQPEE